MIRSCGLSQWSSVVLVGVSGTGKTTVGRLLAERLGWAAYDTDAEIEARFGMTVPDIFARHGEPAFRAAERAILGKQLERDKSVIATGGGAITATDAWTSQLLGGEHVLTVALDAQTATSLRRLQQQVVAEGDAAARPLLVGDDPLAAIEQLKSRRQSSYDRAKITLIVDGLEADEVAREIESIVLGSAPAISLRIGTAQSRIVVSAGSRSRVGDLVRQAYPKARRTWIVTDDGVASHHLQPVSEAIGNAGFQCEQFVVAHGESSKSIAGVSQLYDWMLQNRVERGDVVVALGGGVVGDLAGFAAATTLRGLGLVQVPTTLLAMVDSSVGGKTGINHPSGKNLIGAFYQPPLVIIDPEFLHTLPARERTSGWAEIIKHAVIQPSTPGGQRADLWSFMERNANQLMIGNEPALSYLIRRNVALKGAVVEHDEREAGLRAMLNFGHTIGHAIEAADYHLLHGEAISVGLRAAMRLGEQMGNCDAATVRRLDALLDAFGLPATASADPDRVSTLLISDKKRSGGKQRWVLPKRGGGVEIRDDVPDALVLNVLSMVLDRARHPQ
jgi:shikimate kinase/3-dehydroquinate synthase